MAVVLLEGWEGREPHYTISTNPPDPGIAFGNNAWWRVTTDGGEFFGDPSLEDATPVCYGKQVSLHLGSSGADLGIYRVIPEQSAFIFGGHVGVERYPGTWDQDYLSTLFVGLGDTVVASIWANESDHSFRLMVGGVEVAASPPGTYSNALPTHVAALITPTRCTLYCTSPVGAVADVVVDGPGATVTVDRFYFGTYDTGPTEIISDGPSLLFCDNLFLFSVTGDPADEYSAYPGDLHMLSFSAWNGSWDEWPHYHRSDLGGWATYPREVREGVAGEDDLPYRTHIGAAEALPSAKASYAMSGRIGFPPGPPSGPYFFGQLPGLEAPLADVVILLDAMAVGGDAPGLMPFLFRPAGGDGMPVERWDYPALTIHPDAVMRHYAITLGPDNPHTGLPWYQTTALRRVEFGLQVTE